MVLQQRMKELAVADMGIQSQDAVNLLLVAADHVLDGPALGGIGLAATAAGIKLTAGQLGQVKAAWKGFRAEVLPGLITQVDEENDPLVLWLDRLIPGHAAPIIASAAPSFLRILADKTEERLNVPPAQEVNIGGDAVK